MNINELVTKNKGPLIAIGGAAGGLVVLIIISAWVNMPSDINFGQILVNLIWLIFVAGFVVAAILYAKGRFDGKYLETEEDPYLEDEVLIERPLVTPSVPPTKVPGVTEALEKKRS